MSTLTPAQWSDLVALFDECSELSPAEREQRLSILRRESPMLATRLAAMLAADSSGDGVLERSMDKVVPALLTPGRDSGWETQTGQVLGRYRLLQAIGSGGMGEVWRAERADGEYRQQVAIKLLKRGMDTQAILRRFMQERSILARLNHPNIVRVVDGGSSDEGRPYYVMDQVEGLPLTRYADEAGLDLRARVALVATIADAVAYAHSQLVVHRDLKPSNVLVDASGTPHLLDFGIAKLLEETGEDTLTGTGAHVLTPAYAAPEQIRGEPVGTATDVYALGLMLFELLTGTLPHQRQSRDPAVLASALAQESGTRASQALVVAERAGGRPGSLAGQQRWARQMAGDLDVIIAKALQGQPERRYPTAAALADDLRRWLQGQPIAARPDSAGYRLGRFVRRHRLGAAATVLVACSLVLGLGVALWQAQRAEQQAARAELVKRFVLSLFEEQDPVARASAQARSPAQLIAAGLERADVELAGDPDLRLEVVADLAGLQAGLGDAPAAVERLRGILSERRSRDGDGTAMTAELQTLLASALIGAGDAVAARVEAEQAVATLAASGEDDGLLMARARAQLARVMISTGAAEPALDQIRASHALLVHELGADHPETLEALVNTAVVLERIDRLDAAAEVFSEVIARIERVLGPDHARLVRPLTVLSDIRRRQQRYDEARPLMERTVALARAALGERHPLLGPVLMRQGDLLRRMGDLDAAEASLAEAQAVVSPTSGEAGQVAMYQGGVARARGDHGAAAAAFERSHRLFLGALGPDSIFPWSAAQELANELVALERLDEASDWLERALARQRSIAGPDSFDAASVGTALALLRRRQGRLDDAEALLDHARSRLLAIYGEAHPSTLRLRMELARTLRERGQLAPARAELQAALAHRHDAALRPDLIGALLLESAELAAVEDDAERRRSDAGAAIDIVQAADPGSDLLVRLRLLAR